MARLDDIGVDITKDKLTLRGSVGPFKPEVTRTRPHGTSTHLDDDHRFALSITTDEYDDPDLRRLAAPAPDVEGLMEALRDPKIGCFTAPDPLQNQPAAALEAHIEDFFSDRAPDDVLLLYLSGVAIVEQGQLYLATRDTRLDGPGFASLDATFLRQQMGRCRSQTVAIVLDVAYTAAAAQAGERLELAPHVSGPDRTVLTTSPVLRRFAPASGRVSPTVLTDELVAALRRADTDTNHDGKITADELFDQVRDRVKQVAPTRSPEVLDPTGVGRTLVVALARAKAQISGKGDWKRPSTPASHPARPDTGRQIPDQQPRPIERLGASEPQYQQTSSLYRGSTPGPGIPTPPPPRNPTSPPWAASSPHERPWVPHHTPPRPPRPPWRIMALAAGSLVVVCALVAGILFAVRPGDKKPTTGVSAGGSQLSAGGFLASGPATTTASLPHQPLIFKYNADISDKDRKDLHDRLDKMGPPPADKVTVEVAAMYRVPDPDTTSTSTGGHPTTTTGRQNVRVSLELFLRNGVDRPLHTVDMAMTVYLDDCTVPKEKRKVLADMNPNSHFTLTENAPTIPPGVTLFTGVNYNGFEVKDVNTNLHTFPTSKFCFSVTLSDN